MVMGVRQFEKLFRLAAGLDVDKSDIKRLEDFVNQRLHDLLLMAQRMARMNGRDVITEADVPLTKGLQESMQQFKDMDEQLSASDILAHLARLPALDLAIGKDVEAMLPALAGGITVSLAKVFKVLDPEMKNPQTEHWERVEQLYAILV